MAVHPGPVDRQAGAQLGRRFWRAPALAGARSCGAGLPHSEFLAASLAQASARSIS